MELNMLAYKFQDWYEGPNRLRDVLIISICKHERHRSVGHEWLFRTYLGRVFHVDDLRIEQGTISNYLSSKRMCPDNCPQCNHRDEKLDETLDEAYRIFQTRMDRAWQECSKRRVDTKRKEKAEEEKRQKAKEEEKL